MALYTGWCRAHNYFIATHPWDAQMKKLAGTRAGKACYVAFVTELMAQHGCRLFRTDEAILSPDWIPNLCIICTYDAENREFFWHNRIYPMTRRTYNQGRKESIEKDIPKGKVQGSLEAGVLKTYCAFYYLVPFGSRKLGITMTWGLTVAEPDHPFRAWDWSEYYTSILQLLWISVNHTNLVLGSLWGG